MVEIGIKSKCIAIISGTFYLHQNLKISLNIQKYLNSPPQVVQPDLKVSIKSTLFMSSNTDWQL